MNLLIKGFSLPKNPNGTYFVPSYEVKGVEIGTAVMTLMLDQSTQKLRVSVWNPGLPYGLNETYPCEVVE